MKYNSVPSSLVNINSYRKKFLVFKIFMGVESFFGMMSGVFRNFWLTANGVPLSSLYLFSILGTSIALISQNTIAKLSDRINWRYPFMMAAGISLAAAYLVSAWFPTMNGFLFYVVMVSWVAAENYRTLIAYNFIALTQDPALPLEKINRTREFSKYRIFASVGFAIAGPIVGYGIQAFNQIKGLDSVDGLWGYQMMFTICAIGTICSVICLYVIMRDYIKIEPTLHLFPINNNNLNSNSSESPISNKFGLKELFSNRIYVAVLVPQLIYAFAESVGFGAIDIFFKSLGADTVFIGLRPLIWALAEVPLFFISSTIYRKYSYEIPIFIGYLFFLLKIGVYYLFLTPEYLWNVYSPIMIHNIHSLIVVICICLVCFGAYIIKKAINLVSVHRLLSEQLQGFLDTIVK